MKKALFYFSLTTIAVLLARGPLYRALVSYSNIGERQIITPVNPKLLELFRQEKKTERQEMSDISNTASLLTCKALAFSGAVKSQNPNVTIESGAANCIGYAALFASFAQWLISEQGLSGKYEVKHLKGKLSVLGIDLHRFFEGAFFRDHDFNSIKNLETGEVIYLDPGMEDYLKIHSVTCR